MQGPETELVILVDEQDNPIGTAPKATVHHAETPLHRAFSCFVFRPSGELLLQQRAETKATWPSVWSNSVCGHPAPGEEPEAAVRRRLERELGMSLVELRLALPRYRYRAEHLGVVENEICPVWVGLTAERPLPRPDEVGATRWVPWASFVEGVRHSTEPFFVGLSPWCREETDLLASGETLRGFLSDHGVPS